LRSHRFFSRAVRLLVLLSTGAFAQEIRAVRGTVTDKDGHVLAGAVVQLRNSATLQIRSYITQSDGEYHFELLSTDVTYKVQATYKGTHSRSKAVSRFSSRTLVTIDLVIDLSEVSAAEDDAAGVSVDLRRRAGPFPPGWPG